MSAATLQGFTGFSDGPCFSCSERTGQNTANSVNTLHFEGEVAHAACRDEGLMALQLANARRVLADDVVPNSARPGIEESVRVLEGLMGATS